MSESSIDPPLVVTEPFKRLPGEQDFLCVARSSETTGDGVALAYPVDEDGIPIRCGLHVTNYRTIIIPARGQVIIIPHMNLDSWSVDKHAMTATQRAAFPQSMNPSTNPITTGGGASVSSPVVGGAPSTSSSAAPNGMPLATSAFTLTLTTKYLWNFQVMFQDERQVWTTKKILENLRPHEQKHMPAFELYRERCKEATLVSPTSSVANRGESPTVASANDETGAVTPTSTTESKPFTPAEPFSNYGWNIYSCRHELARQTCLDPSVPVGSLEDDTVKAGPGCDLRYWFRATRMAQEFFFSGTFIAAATSLLVKRALDPSVPVGSLEDDTVKAGPGYDLRYWFRATRMAQEDNMYGRSPTYPFEVVAPNIISDPALVEAIYARSRGRIPGISFVHLRTGAVLGRCSQPVSKGDAKKDADVCYALVNSGYTVKNSKPRRHTDPFGSGPQQSTGGAPGRSVAPPPSLIDSNDAPAPEPTLPHSSANIAAARRTRTLMVADCRPSSAAYGNQTMGGGFESGPTYDFCKVKFHGIDNIHGVTKSFNQLKSIVNGFNGKSPRESFLSQLHDSQWFYHIQKILICSVEIAEGMERGESFLVHCTDGWDRTSQCTSIAMLLLDPFYRTTLGFCTLIEKEFCSFGHKFAERCNHMVRGETYYTTDSGVSSSDTESQRAQQAHKLQPSPIFVQWLDCIFQIMRQFPNKFEFTPLLLELLASEVYSCHYGTFLANSEKERVFERIRLSTTSLWTQVLDSVAREKSGEALPFFLNTFYNAQDAWRFISKKEGSGLQFMPISCSSKRLSFWEAHYLRFDSDNLSLRVSDAQGNLMLENHRRMEAPYFCEPLEQYLDAIITRARQERAQDIPYMTELLQRLHVQRPPPLSSASQANAKVAPIDSKSCSHCHEKFNFFATKEYCSRCTTRAPLCTKCIRTVGGKKVCPKCADLEEILNDE
ncbi:zinc-binding phosphatase, putative [Bodo saltans]|uniref:Zinc-binding phosphatase, putative n=1 Tax=Bodo saltans TaxID=75058 RepID=A0A0S4J9Y5_BODSA|nr:zinc-binding phosphatase, putative [Bodo saltans]|eukprot:CUG87006.1 zinc-binding phosphatase, putative [Bodo saltans]